MEVVDSRRLTGINIYDARAGAIARIRLAPGEDVGRTIASWKRALERGLAELRWTASMHARPTAEPDGSTSVALMFTAQVDRLYAATELNEWAISTAAGSEPELGPISTSALAEQRARAGVLPLIEAAEQRGIPWLVDDEWLSLGFGCHGRVWSLESLPGPEGVPWADLGAIPVALVTGTNGKTTTSRLLARMAREHGHTVGNTSTDGICVDGREVESGDWTGPGAARDLLRRPELDLAVLEVARGGLLRRGLEVRGCDVAVVTNVDRDHLGEYGVHSLADMAQVKGLVCRSVRNGGLIVLGADSPALVEWAARREFSGRVEWFSPDSRHPVLRAQLESGGSVWTVDNGLAVRRGPEPLELLPLAGIPITFGGRARHNVANVLAASAAAHGLGIGREAIVRALSSFGGDPADNPGRAGAWALPGGVTLLIDFAHNFAGIRAIAELVAELGRPVTVSFSMAGDRSDDDLRALAAALTEFDPRAVVLREQQRYRRGRALHELPTLLREGLEATGYSPSAIHIADNEVESLVIARRETPAGGLIVLLVHAERGPVEAYLRELGAQPTRL